MINSSETLEIYISAADAIDLNLMNELAFLHEYLETRNTFCISKLRLSAYIELGLDKSKLRHLLVIGPGKLPIMLPRLFETNVSQKTQAEQFLSINGKTIRELYFKQITNDGLSKMVKQPRKINYDNEKTLPSNFKQKSHSKDDQMLHFAKEETTIMYKKILKTTLIKLCKSR